MGRYGRFGNQMFQYATLYSIAQIKGYEFGVPMQKKSKNPYENFCLNECFFNLSAKDSSNYVTIYTAQEKEFIYNDEIFKISDDTDIVGYFQSEKYFKDYRKKILKEYEFNKEIKDLSTNIISSIEGPKISIHLRLGDYKNLKEKHPICSIDYYKKALEILPKNIKIIAFSDEPELAKLIFNELNRDYYLSETNNQYIDMCLMTLCDYHIIANSSFSWWGAWLSESKKVIAPSIWFGDSPEMPKNWSDIYCESWEKI
jgi:hypothetical protein